MGMKTIFLLFTVASACSAYTVKQPTITLVEPQGIQFAYPAEPGVNLVAYHFNINVQLQGVAAGQYNVDVTSPTNGYFIYKNANVIVNLGDTVYYWIHVITDTGGYVLENQVWIAESPTPTTTSPTTTTKAPVQTTPEVVATTTTTTTTPPVQTTTGVVVTEDPNDTPAPGTTRPPTTGGNGGGGSGSDTVVDVCSQYPCGAECDMNKAPCNGLIFEENWDTLDMTRWQHEITMSGGGNWEFQYYTNNRSNSYVRDNTLFIKPTLTADHYGESFLSSGTLDLWGSAPADVCTGNSFWGCQRSGSGTNYINPIQSARIRTVNSFAVRYGRIEVETKMPQGDWIWPAIWLLPRDNPYGGWPASGEIDVVESRGNVNLKDQNGHSKGCDNMGMTLHWGPYWPLNAYELTTVESLASSGTFASEFHKWVVDWTEDHINFYVDGQLLNSVDPGAAGFWQFGDFDTSAPGAENPWKESPNKMAPFDQEFYILLNVAVGGTNGFFPDSWTNSPNPKPWMNTSPTAMRDFWQGKNDWYPTWQPTVNRGENAALQVKNIKVWANY